MAALIGACLLLTACTGPPRSPRATDEALVTGYLDAMDAAAADGAAAQQRFFDLTQHPDLRRARCALDGLTVTAQPALSTLRVTPGWRPTPAAAPPRGTVYTVAAELTVSRDGVVQGNQIGSLHVVIVDGTAYGFMPCPA